MRPQAEDIPGEVPAEEGDHQEKLMEVNRMNYEQKSAKLKKVLKLSGEPVGVKYTNKPPRQSDDGYYPVCGAIPGAAQGKTIVLSKETCACPGGVMHLGLAKEEVVHGEMLVEGGEAVGEPDRLPPLGDGYPEDSRASPGTGRKCRFLPVKGEHR